jgi:hypothetical protein
LQAISEAVPIPTLRKDFHRLLPTRFSKLGCLEPRRSFSLLHCSRRKPLRPT